MRDQDEGKKLLSELLADPGAFTSLGREYALLQAYFRGLPLETLSPLLTHQENLVRRAAAFVVSELGAKACSVIDDVIPLLSVDDRFLRYHALEVVAVCATGERADRYHYLLRALADDDEVLRGLSMRLVSKADMSQLQAGVRFFEAAGSRDSAHLRGLAVLLRGESADVESVDAMLSDSESLLRRYGAIAAKHLRKRFPALIERAASSGDVEVVKFAAYAKETPGK